MSTEASGTGEPGNFVVLGEDFDTMIDGIRHRLVYTRAPDQQERPDAAKDRRLWVLKEASTLLPFKRSMSEDTSIEDRAVEVIQLAQLLADWVEEA